MRYFVIGTGSIGRRHFENLVKLGADVVALPWRGLDLPKLLVEIKKCSGFAGVVLATSSDIRFPLISELANAGAALYIEKPISFLKEDIDRIYQLPNEIKQRSVAGFMMRYHPIVQKILSFRRQKTLVANFYVGHDVQSWREGSVFSESYASKKYGGGVTLDLCHELDLAVLMCGLDRLENVVSLVDERFEAVDVATSITFLGSNSCLVSVGLDYLSPSIIRYGNIVTDDYSLTYDLNANSVRLDDNEICVEDMVCFERNHMFVNLMRDFTLIAEGKVAANPFCPTLDKVEASCRFISDCWEARRFHGNIKTRLR